MTERPTAFTTDDQRRQAIVDFLSAAISDSVDKSTLVSALAHARRALAEHLQRGGTGDAWVDGEVRFRGVREAAAIVAFAETEPDDDEAFTRFRREHPERVGLLDGLLRTLGPQSPQR